MTEPMPAAAQPTRARMLERCASSKPFDLLIIGGGATGLGVAVDAAASGFSVALLEAEDFAKGTSSRATKLVHGGVRYLAQGNVALVREALHERTALLANAPHLAQPLPFVMPVYGPRGRWFDKWFYGAGLVAYDALAGRAGIGHTEFLNVERTRERLPGVRTDQLSGSVQYWDGQFDDARLALTLARTAIDHGACVLNHCRVVGLLHEGDKVRGARAVDTETGNPVQVAAHCVINATGVWVDAVRRMDQETVRDMVAPSQGVHLVVDREFFPGDHALLVPKTADGRVLFAVPWLGKTILGTTDTPRQDLAEEPRAFPEEVAFILSEAARYLARAPRARDVRSIWVGLRPLVKPPEDAARSTKKLSREHTVAVGPSGMVTVTGGKWTTYRAMAEDVLEECVAHGLLRNWTPGKTASLRLHAAPARASKGLHEPPGLHLYGLDADAIDALPGADTELAPGLSEAMVRHAARAEFARTVEDVLARRSRLLFLDAAAAIRAAPRVGALLAEELGAGFDALASVARFDALARGYLLAND